MFKLAIEDNEKDRVNGQIIYQSKYQELKEEIINMQLYSEGMLLEQSNNNHV